MELSNCCNKEWEANPAYGFTCKGCGRIRMSADLDTTKEPKSKQTIKDIVKAVFYGGYYFERYYNNDGSEPKTMNTVDGIKAIESLIEERCAERERLAVIRELNVLYIGNYPSNPYKTDRYIIDRLDELEAQQSGRQEEND